MAGIIPFDFETNAVRIVMQDGIPWFVAADVCRVLDHSNPTVALSRLDGDEKSIINPKKSLGSNGGRGGAQTMNIVSESGLYALIMSSNKPAAKRFRKWVTSEVLPAINRDGRYITPSPDLEVLEERRAYYAGLPDPAQERAREKVAVVRRWQELVDQGWKSTEAARAVAEEYGIGERTVWNYRSAIYMVPETDHEVALGRKGMGQNPARYVDVHPEFMRLFMDMVLSGQRVSTCYQRLLEIAEENGWEPIPSERTMRRRASTVLSGPARRKLH